MAQGATTSLVGVTKERIADFVHGSDGFGNTNQEFVDDGRALPISAAQFIVESAAKWPGEVVVLALGPLTNVALALHLKPDLPALLVCVRAWGGGIARVAMEGCAYRPGVLQQQRTRALRVGSP